MGVILCRLCRGETLVVKRRRAELEKLVSRIEVLTNLSRVTFPQQEELDGNIWYLYTTSLCDENITEGCGEKLKARVTSILSENDYTRCEKSEDDEAVTAAAVPLPKRKTEKEKRRGWERVVRAAAATTKTENV